MLAESRAISIDERQPKGRKARLLQRKPEKQFASDTAPMEHAAEHTSSEPANAAVLAPISKSLTDSAQLERQVDGFSLFAIGRWRRHSRTPKLTRCSAGFVLAAWASLSGTIRPARRDPGGPLAFLTLQKFSGYTEARTTAVRLKNGTRRRVLPADQLYSPLSPILITRCRLSCSWERGAGPRAGMR